MNAHDERLAKAKQHLREKAHTPRQREVIPLADEIQTFFYAMRVEEKSDVPRLKEIYKQILELDKKIMECIIPHAPSGEDEGYFITWLYNFQADIFANWSMKVGYILDDLEKRTDAFSLHVDRQLAHPWADFHKTKFAYEDVLRRAKELIDDYYDLLEFKTCHVTVPKQSALRSPKDVRQNMVKRIDDLSSICLERVQSGIERMRELYFKFSDHRFAEESARNAAMSARASKASVVTGIVTIVLSSAALIIGILQLFTPTTIQTSSEKPLQVQNEDRALRTPSDLPTDRQRSSTGTGASI